MVIGILGWFLLGVITSTVLVTFWDDIREWLNNTAANAVERFLGYGARDRMYRAIARIDRVMNVIRNQTVVYTKRSSLDTTFDKTTLVAEANPYEIDKDVLQQIRKEKTLVQEFEYKHA